MLEVIVGLSVNTPLRAAHQATLARKLEELVLNTFSSLEDQVKCTVAYEYKRDDEYGIKVKVNLVAIRSTSAMPNPEELDLQVPLGVLYTTRLKESLIPDLFRQSFHMPPESITVDATLYRKI